MAEKPSHNKHDNIWEIRTQGYRGRAYPPERWMKEIQERGSWLKVSPENTAKVGRGLLFHDVDDFCRALIFSPELRLPVYKILIPNLDKAGVCTCLPVGVIYYLAEVKDGPGFSYRTYCFRGTYGYAGTGPHESAKIEALLEARGSTLALRSGDYLLQFFTEGDRPEEGS